LREKFTMPMERTASVEDMVGNLWRLGRTPSQAEFETFFSNIAQVGSQGNLMAQAAAAQAAQAAQPETNGTDAAASGIPRVASIDLLRKMIMQGQQPAVAPAMVPNLMNPMAGMGAMQPGIAGAGEHPDAPATAHFPALGVTRYSDKIIQKPTNFPLTPAPLPQPSPTQASARRV